MKKISVLWLMSLLLVLAGCSSDNDSERSVLDAYEWRLGPDEYYIGSVMDVDEGARRAMVQIYECPDNLEWADANDPPFSLTVIFFDPSDLPDMSRNKGDQVVFRIKSYQRLKNDGVGPQSIDYTHRYNCVVEPYHGTAVVEGLTATIREDGNYGWYIRYADGKKVSRFYPMAFDKEFQQDGRRVTFSGEVYKYTGFSATDANSYRIRIASIQSDGGFDTSVDHLSYTWKLIGYGKDGATAGKGWHWVDADADKLTLELKSDGTFHGHTASNEFFGTFESAGNCNFQVTDYVGTMVMEHDEDSQFFDRYFPTVSCYSIFGNDFLKLYYSDVDCFYFKNLISD